MKKALKALLFPAAAAAIAALPLAGCHEGNRTNDPQKETVEQNEAKTDSLSEDSIKAFYERMRHWDALHGGMRHRESEK